MLYSISNIIIFLCVNVGEERTDERGIAHSSSWNVVLNLKEIGFEISWKDKSGPIYCTFLLPNPSTI